MIFLPCSSSVAEPFRGLAVQTKASNRRRGHSSRGGGGGGGGGFRHFRMFLYVFVCNISDKDAKPFKLCDFKFSTLLHLLHTF